MGASASFSCMAASTPTLPTPSTCAASPLCFARTTSGSPNTITSRCHPTRFSAGVKHHVKARPGVATQARVKRPTMNRVRSGKKVSTYKNMSRDAKTPKATNRSKSKGTRKKLVTPRWIDSSITGGVEGANKSVRRKSRNPITLVD